MLSIKSKSAPAELREMVQNINAMTAIETHQRQQKLSRDLRAMRHRAVPIGWNGEPNQEASSGETPRGGNNQEAWKRKALTGNAK